MSYEFYHFFHLVAILSLFLALGGLLANFNNRKQKRKLMILHGLAGLIVFVTGFGLIARLGVQMTSLWIIGKIGIWILLSVFIPMFITRNILKKRLWVLTLISGFCAVWLVIYKI